MITIGRTERSTLAGARVSVRQPKTLSRENMNSEQEKFLSESKFHDLRNFWSATGTSEEHAASFILSEIKNELSKADEGERGFSDELVWLVFFLSDIDQQLELLHELLLMPGHFQHQAVTKEIQESLQ